MNKRVKTTLVLLLFAVTVPLPVTGGGRSESPQAPEAIEIREPWARAVMNAGGNTGAYMRIGNATDVTDRLVAARAGGVRTVELHTHEMDGEVARMRRVPEIELPAGEVVELAPMGLHVMLMGVEEPLHEGDNLDLVLVFENAGEIELTVPVRSITGQPAQRSGHD